MLEDRLLREFAERLADEASERAEELGEGMPLLRDTALVDVMLGYMEEAGLVSEHELCPFEDASGRNRGRILAYALPEDSNRLDLFTGLSVPESEDYLGADELSRLSGRAAKFFGHVAAGDFDRFSGTDMASNAVRHIFGRLQRIDEVKVHILTNGLVRNRGAIDPVTVAGRDVEFSVVDLERLFRASRETITRDQIEVDFRKPELLGRPIPCLEMRPRPREYETYLVLLPGDIVFKLYEEFGPRLFEFNVRSFLQARGRVNKGLRETLRSQPERFLAYNNGITATADEIEAGQFGGEMTISRIRGLQIVNGAQTTASLHRARKIDRTDISSVALAMKLTLVEPAKLAEFVPLIAKYSNTQNVIQVSDLSANNDFHIRIEQLSETVWCPGEEQRWFYERTRGAYQVALARHGTTPARRREFERECPKTKRFSKTDLAKILMAWWQRPQTVSRGSQKNFSIFMADLPDQFPVDWAPDEAFYRNAVALALMWKAAHAAVRRSGVQAYQANVLAFMIAKLSADFGDQVDFDGIWDAQEISPELVEMFEDWAPRIHDAIDAGAGRANVTEWCKKDESWDLIRDLDLGLPEIAPREIISDRKKDVPVDAHVPDQRSEAPIRAGREVVDGDPIALCCSVQGRDWPRIIAWCVENRRITDFDHKVALTLAGYAMDGWRKRPSEKQARIGERVLKAAFAGGALDLARA